MPDLCNESPRDQVIGEYRLERKLSGGGFGTVYLAEHIYDHAQVAIKILHVPLTKSEDFRDFINEARMMVRLRHPHIIPLLDFGMSREDLPFLVMEYIPGKTILDYHPRGSRVPLATVVAYVEQIASALQHAHEQRIIHRDVKPANMLLHADGTLLLGDFGIAKFMEQNTLMSVQAQIGTPAYMAPEQHKGYLCYASDQYALAVVTYKWISGRLPFLGDPEGQVSQHVEKPPPSLLNLCPTLSPYIEKVIFKALSKEPEQRYATMQEFATAFRAAVEQATAGQIDTKELPLDEISAADAHIQPSVAAVSIHAESQNAIQSSLADQSAEDDVTHRRPAPAQTSNALSSNQLYSTAPQPIAAAEEPFISGKAPRRLPPLSRNPLFLSSALLVGLLILAFVINLVSINLQHLRENPGTSPSTPTTSALNASTVSHLAKKWTFATGDAVSSSPAVVDNVVYIGSWDHKVYALDAQSGQQKWTFQTGGSVFSSPAVVGGVVYIGSWDHKVYALDAQTGQQKWAFQTGNPVVSLPTVVNGVVYIGSADSKVYALDAQSGQQKWAFPTSGRIESSPAVADGVVYIGSDDHKVYALDAQSGQQKWTFTTQGSVLWSSPAVVGGVVYIGSEDSKVYALDAQSGQQKWAFQTGDRVESLPKVVDGMVYIGSWDHKVYALDAQSGQQKWTFTTESYVVSLPAVVGGVVYFGSDDHKVYALDAQSGQPKWTFQTGGPVHSSPAVVNNIIYIGSQDGNVYAFALPNG